MKKVKCCKETVYGVTFGKIYDVIDEDCMFFIIKDDHNKERLFRKDYFWAE